MDKPWLFKKGWEGGPGRPKTNQELRDAWAEMQKARAKAINAYTKAFAKMIDWTAQDIRSFCNSQNENIVETLVARGILRVLNSKNIADYATLRSMFCGAEPKELQATGPDGEPLNSHPLAAYSQEVLAALFMKLDNIAKEAECKSMAIPQQSSESSPLLPQPSPDTES